MPDQTSTWRERDAELIAPAYSRYSDLVVESADGAHLHTVDGRDVLDFGCGIGVTSLGHRHPALTGAFHGRTYGAMTLTASRAKYRTGVGPFLPGVHHVRFPYCFRFCAHGPDERCPIAEGEDLQRLFATTVPPETVAAIIVEPVLGEGGIVVPPVTFLPSLRKLCDEHGILLIADEIQCGLA